MKKAVETVLWSKAFWIFDKWRKIKVKNLVTCMWDRVNYAVHEKFGRVGSDFFCLLCYNISLLVEVFHGVKKKMYRLYSTGVYWRFLNNQ